MTRAPKVPPPGVRCRGHYTCPINGCDLEPGDRIGFTKGQPTCCACVMGRPA